MKLILLTILCMGFISTSCTSVQPVVCAVETSAASALSTQIASALTCTNTAAIQSDILKSLGKADVCSTTVASFKSLKGPIGDIVCPIAVTAVLGLVSDKVPASWGCSATSTSTLGTLLTTACENNVKQ